jgi:biotin carboxyl carrier protein
MKTVESPVSGVIQQYMVKVGDTITEGQEVVMMESMKMEIPVVAEVSGTVAEVCCEPGANVAEGAALLKLS